MNKEESARYEGMAYAYRIAKQKGIEGLEEEIKFRNATQIPLSVSRQACDEAINRIKENTLDTILIMSVAVLHDDFKMGQIRIQRFMDCFERKTLCLNDSYVTWQDFIDDIKETLDITLAIRENN